MIRFIAVLLLVQALYCAEFPDLERHVKLTWNHTSFEQKFDGSRTVSDKDGNVDGFILCASYFNDGANGDCSYDYAYAEESSSGSIFSASGKGNFITKVVSKDDADYSCLKFLNPIGGFKDVYEATLVKKGSWNVSYDCKKYIPEKDYTWFIVAGVILGALVIVGAIFGVIHLKKKKNGKEGQTTGGRDGLLQNA